MAYGDYAKYRWLYELEMYAEVATVKTMYLGFLWSTSELEYGKEAKAKLAIW